MKTKFVTLLVSLLPLTAVAFPGQSILKNSVTKKFTAKKMAEEPTGTCANFSGNYRGICTLSLEGEQTQTVERAMQINQGNCRMLSISSSSQGASESEFIRIGYKSSVEETDIAHDKYSGYSSSHPHESYQLLSDWDKRQQTLHFNGSMSFLPNGGKFSPISLALVGKMQLVDSGLLYTFESPSFFKMSCDLKRQ